MALPAPSQTRPTTFSLRQLARYAAIYVAWILLHMALTGGFKDFSAWLSSWYILDSSWYEKIWNQGYEEPKALAFPPGYSFLTGALSKLIFTRFDTAATALNIAAFFAAMVIAAETLAKVISVSPLRLFILSLTAPAGYFIFPAYSDAVFCLVFWSALALALSLIPSRKTKAVEFGLLFLAPWIRITGYTLISWGCLRKWTPVACILSLCGWLALNWSVTVQALYFIQIQKSFLMSEGTIIDGFLYSWNGLFSPLLPGVHAGWQDYFKFHLLPILYLLALGLTAIWFCRTRHWLISINMLAVLVMSHNQGFWRSAMRCDLPLMPYLFVPLLAQRWKSEFTLGAVIGVLGLAQFILQITFSNIFRAGEWGF